MLQRNVGSEFNRCGITLLCYLIGKRYDVGKNTPLYKIVRIAGGKERAGSGLNQEGLYPLEQTSV